MIRGWLNRRRAARAAAPEGQTLIRVGVAILGLSVVGVALLALSLYLARNDDKTAQRNRGVSECSVNILLIPPDQRAPLLPLDTLEQVCRRAAKLRDRLARANASPPTSTTGTTVASDEGAAPGPAPPAGVRQAPEPPTTAAAAPPSSPPTAPPPTPPTTVLPPPSVPDANLCSLVPALPVLCGPNGLLDG